MARIRKLKKKKKFISTCDNEDRWSNFNPDLLLLIVMRVGVFDYIAFSGVCKSWRSVALSNWNKFMMSKQPIRLSISDRLNKKDLYLKEDSKRRKLKTRIPHSNGRVCVGLTCGYLIFYGSKTCDFWLVNPLTWKQLHFPGFPLDCKKLRSKDHIRGVLVFSPLMSGWVLVVSFKYYNKVFFSLAGKQARWRNIIIGSYIHDIHFFNGKIYILYVDKIDTFYHLGEVRLNDPEEPTLILHKLKNFLCSYTWLDFVSSCEKLYVRNYRGDVSHTFEVDFDEMKCVSSERTIGEYALFLCKFIKCDAAIKPDTSWTQYERRNFSRNDNMGGRYMTDMWYFPHECLINDNYPDMRGHGALLNILKD